MRSMATFAWASPNVRSVFARQGTSSQRRRRDAEVGRIELTAAGNPRRGDIRTLPVPVQLSENDVSGDRVGHIRSLRLIGKSAAGSEPQICVPVTQDRLC